MTNTQFGQLFQPNVVQYQSLGRHKTTRVKVQENRSIKTMQLRY